MKKETNRSGKRAWNPIVVLALALCAVFGLSALTYSWLTQSATATPKDESNATFVQMSIDDFAYTLQYSFDGTNWSDYSAQQQDDWLRGIEVNPVNSSADDYIGKLHVQVKQTGTVKSAVRVRFDYQWFKTETTTGEDGTNKRAVQGPALTLTPVITGSNPWSHTQGDRYYYYYDGSTYVLPRNQFIRIADGFSLASAPSVSNAQLRIIVTVDGVQFNRYREVWEVSTIPGGNS